MLPRLYRTTSTFAKVTRMSRWFVANFYAHLKNYKLDTYFAFIESLCNVHSVFTFCTYKDQAGREI